jgi:hypothetical protein
MPTFKKVQPGAKLRISAADYNGAMDAAAWYDRNQRSLNAQFNGPFGYSQIALVKNNCGEDRQRFEILGIGGVVMNPSTAEAGFLEKICVTGVTPVVGTHDHAFVVLLEPIADGKIGRCMIDGVTPARVTITTPSGSTDSYAGVSDSSLSPYTLVTGASGGAQVLWSGPGGSTDDWALIRIRSGTLGVETETVVVAEIIDGPDSDGCYTVQPRTIQAVYTGSGSGSGSV